MSRAVVALGVLGLLLLTTPVNAKDIPQEITTLLAQEQYSAAVAPLTEFLDKDKKNHEGWTLLADAYYNLGHDNDARTAYEAALKLKKKHWPAVHGHIRVLTRLEDYAEADKQVRKAIRDTKKDEQIQAMFYHDLGIMQLAQGRRDTTKIDEALLDSADINFYVAIGQAPDSCQFRLDLGEINFARKRYPMAISSYEDVLACNAEMCGAVHYRIARAYLYQREFSAAVGAYQKSAECKPTAKVYSDLGDALILYSRSLPLSDTAKILDLYNQAIASYTEAKKYAADGCRLYEKVGKAEALMGRLDAAAEDFQAAIECGSRDPDVFFALGNVLIDLARFDEALGWYDRYRGMREESLATEPWDKPDADFFANYAMAARVKADSMPDAAGKDSVYWIAIQNYERSLELDSARADIMDDLGIAYYQMGEYRRGIGVFERKIEMEPELTNGYLNLAYCYLQLKVWDSVLVALDGMLGVDSCNHQAFEIAGYVAAFEMKNGRVAREWYNRQLACEPTNCDAKMFIGYTYLVTNDTTQIKKCIPVLKEAYDCRLAQGEDKCGENFKNNALWVAEAEMALRNLDQAVRWSQKVLNCEPGHARATQINEQAKSEY